MKKLLTLIILLVLMVNYSPAQLKVTFQIAPYRVISGGIVSYMVQAVVPAGQVWKVGNFNLKISYSSNPASNLTVHPDATVDSALSGLTSGIYMQYNTNSNTTTPPTISMNLLTLQTAGFLNLGPGTYNLGHIRFNITTPFYSDTLKFRNPPLAVPVTVVYDSTKKCAYGGSASDSSRYTTPSTPVITGVSGNTAELPKEFQLYQNFPNPFNPVTNIRFDIPKASFVKVKVYDLLGKEIANLINTEMEPGRYDVNWDGTNFASGIYFYRIEAKDFTKVMKMILIK